MIKASALGFDRDAAIMGAVREKWGRCNERELVRSGTPSAFGAAMLAFFRAVFGAALIPILLAACSVASDEDAELEPGSNCERVVLDLGACMTDAMKNDYAGACRGAKAFSARCRLEGCHCEGSRFVCAPETCAPD